MDKYRTLYDISSGGFNWLFPALFLLVIIISIILIFFSRWYYKNNEKESLTHQRLFYNLNHPTAKNAFTRFPKFFLGFGIVLFILSMVFIPRQYIQVKNIYKKNEFSTMEGIVKKIKPIEESGEGQNTIIIEDQKFKYSYPNFNSIFTNIGSYDEIKIGDFVRIDYYGEYILKLEIRVD